MKSRLGVCPRCGGQKIRLIKEDLAFDFRGRKPVVPQVECEECPDCGEVITDDATNQYIDAVVFGHERCQAS
jgi:YgiT-type zinc finger domain-containing protein